MRRDMEGGLTGAEMEVEIGDELWRGRGEVTYRELWRHGYAILARRVQN